MSAKSESNRSPLEKINAKFYPPISFEQESLHKKLEQEIKSQLSEKFWAKLNDHTKPISVSYLYEHYSEGNAADKAKNTESNSSLPRKALNTESNTNNAVAAGNNISTDAETGEEKNNQEYLSESPKLTLVEKMSSIDAENDDQTLNANAEPTSTPERKSPHLVVKRLPNSPSIKLIPVLNNQPAAEKTSSVKRFSSTLPLAAQKNVIEQQQMKARPQVITLPQSNQQQPTVSIAELSKNVNKYYKASPSVPSFISTYNNLATYPSQTDLSSSKTPLRYASTTTTTTTTPSNGASSTNRFDLNSDSTFLLRKSKTMVSANIGGRPATAIHHRVNSDKQTTNSAAESGLKRSNSSLFLVNPNLSSSNQAAANAAATSANNNVPFVYPTSSVAASSQRNGSIRSTVNKFYQDFNEEKSAHTNNSLLKRSDSNTSVMTPKQKQSSSKNSITLNNNKK